MVLVFLLTLSVSGMRRALTYGSDNPLGSIGIKFLPWRTLVFVFCMAQRQSQNRMKQHKIFHLDSCGYLVICLACTERNIFSFFLIRTRPCGLFPGIKSHFPNKRGETLLSGSVRRRRGAGGRLKYKNRLAEFNDKWNSS